MRYKDRTGKEVCANGQQDVCLQNCMEQHWGASCCQC